MVLVAVVKVPAEDVAAAPCPRLLLFSARTNCSMRIKNFRLYDFAYLLLITYLCLYILSWDKGFCNKHFVYEQGFVQVGDKIL